MSFQVTVLPASKVFAAGPNKSVLQSALDSGISLPFSCRSGMCMTCRGQVVQGQIDFGSAHERYLSKADREKGFALLCCATALSDLVIKVPDLPTSQPSGKFPTRVLELKRVSDDVMVVLLGFPPNQPVHFRAGQFLDIFLKSGDRRSYSIANAPKAQGVRQIELHIRHLPGGQFTDLLFSTLKVRDLLQVELPLGSFFLREEKSEPIVMLASGTGFAPIKSMLLKLAEEASSREIHFYWGGRKRTDLYELAAAQRLSEQLPNLSFIPVLSDAEPEETWSGRTGFVHHAVMADFPDLSKHRVYACGAPVVIESARRDFVQTCGLDLENFHADSFLTAIEKAAV
jgi:CDP-4-dehydro-6-deoxyglucose reductase, E3